MTDPVFIAGESESSEGAIYVISLIGYACKMKHEEARQ